MSKKNMQFIWEVNEKLKDLADNVVLTNNMPPAVIMAVRENIKDTMELWKSFEEQKLFEDFEKSEIWEIAKVKGRMESLYYLLMKSK